MKTQHLTVPRPRAFGHGLMAGARQEFRTMRSRVAALLKLLDREDPTVSHAVTCLLVAGLAIGTLLAATAPGLASVLPDGDLTTHLVPVLLILLAGLQSFAMMRHRRVLVARHAMLAQLLGVRSAIGMGLGLSLMLMPGAIAVFSQCVRHGTLPTLGAASVLVVAFVDLLGACHGLRTIASARWAVVPRLIVPGGWLTAAVLQAFASSEWLGHWSEGVMPTAGSLTTGLAVTILAGVGIAALSRYLGIRRLGPRTPAAHRSAGVLVVITGSLGWLGAVLLTGSGPWAPVGVHAVMAAALVAVLLLRARHVRFLSAESLGHALLLARDAGADPRRILRHYMVNSVILFLPVYAGASALLFMLGEPVGVLLLVALAAFELGLNGLLTQRLTVVLPARALAELTTRSKSGLAAALSFSVIFMAGGAAGLSPVIDLGAASPLVIGASLLLLLSAAVMLWLTRLDAPTWLTTLRST